MDKRKLLYIFVFTLGLIASCDNQEHRLTTEERKKVDSIVRSASTRETLVELQEKFENEGNQLGSIVALRELGKLLRRENKFDEALRAHSKGLKQAEEIQDTVEWVQALNNIGTNYRRIGVLDAAQEYHYRAKVLSEEHTDTSFVARKNLVMSLNGLGNIYMTLGNFDYADSVLRKALQGEQELGSSIGQAINYANLGCILEHRGDIDSAWAYYRRAMALNHESGNELGISLCHTYFGSLYERSQEYHKATREYQSAYELMKASKDEWHAINSLIALSGIYMKMGDDAEALKHLANSLQMAERINSKEHLSEIHDLYYQYYKSQGNYRAALTSYELSREFQDSVMNIEKVNRVQNISLSIERNRQERLINNTLLKLETERSTRNIVYTVFVVLVLVFVILLLGMWYIQRLRKRNHLALKKMIRLREDFFTNITHEFRTPLTVILGLSRELYSVEEHSEKVSNMGKIIEQQGSNLLELINQLLDISKIKSAIGNPDWRNGNIVAYLTMVVDSYRDYAKSRHIELQLVAREAIDMDFVPDYMNKIMNNLLSNAFKFTPEYGKVSVIVGREHSSISIEVSDSGIGIGAEALPHIFEPFYQGPHRIKQLGTGLGLALVRQIVETLEGNISVKSTPQQGTTFRLVLPVRNMCDQAATPLVNIPLLPKEELTLDTSNKCEHEYHLLVVEDNRDVARYIGAMLSENYSISYASNGKEGLEMALEFIPDLVITDLTMPEMDGLEVCRQIRSNEIINHIPVIMVTAKVSEAERIKGLEAGADAYLTKPFNAEELRTRVEKLLDTRKLLREKFARAILSEEEDTKASQIILQNEAEMAFLTKVSDIIQHQLSLRKEIDVPTIATCMHMSTSQLYRKMTTLTGYTPAGYIQRVKIQKALTLISQYSEMSFGDVADQSGFNDYSNFVRSFKNVCGITPTEYRKRKSIAS